MLDVIIGIVMGIVAILTILSGFMVIVAIAHGMYLLALIMAVGTALGWFLFYMDARRK